MRTEFLRLAWVSFSGMGSKLPYEPEVLYKSALAAAERAYAPYSGFRIGAALMAESGETVTAGHVENASFSVTICAERAAVARAVAEGHSRFAAIAISGPSDSVSPCGACRQVLNEFASDDMAVTFMW